MPELTLESLAARVTELERKLATTPTPPTPVNDWRALVGTMQDNEFTRQWIAEMEAIREEDRRAAQEGRAEDAA